MHPIGNTVQDEAHHKHTFCIRRLTPHPTTENCFETFSPSTRPRTVHMPSCVVCGDCVGIASINFRSVRFTRVCILKNFRNVGIQPHHHLRLRRLGKKITGTTADWNKMRRILRNVVRHFFRRELHMADAMLGRCNGASLLDSLGEH